MPEGPETRREARKIRPLEDHLIKLVPVNKLLTDRKYAEARHQLAAIPKVVRVRRVIVHGKELFLELTYPKSYHVHPPTEDHLSGKQDKQGEDAKKGTPGEAEEDDNVVYLQGHMGMGGCLYSLDGSDGPTRYCKGVAHRHVLLELRPLQTAGSASGSSVSGSSTASANLGPGWGFADLRGFGYLRVLSPQEYEEHLAAKGPDVMGRHLSESYVAEHIGKSKRKVAALLLDQGVVSGIGNYLRSEILWEARIDPFKKGCELTAEELHRLYEAMRAVPREAYERGEDYRFRVYKQPLDREGMLTSFEGGKNQKIWWTPSRLTAE